MTEAAGSLAAVMSACCGDRYMRPALYKRKAVTVPKRTIHATPKKICGSKKASQSICGAKAQQASAPMIILTARTKVLST